MFHAQEPPVPRFTSGFVILRADFSKK